MPVMTFSTTYPSYHKRRGERTDFIEKIWAFLVDEQIAFPEFWEGWYNLNTKYDFDGTDFQDGTIKPKFTTIRAGKKRKAGDIIKPVIWGNDINPKSGRSGAYHSKQIQFAPPLEIKKVYDFEIDIDEGLVQVYINGLLRSNIEEIAKNDGLPVEDFKAWFKWGKAFSGQILTWSDDIKY